MAINNCKCVEEQSPTIKVKVFLNEYGVSAVMTDTTQSIEIEFIDEVAGQEAAREGGCNDTENCVEAYVDKLCSDGFVYVDDKKITVTNEL